MYLRHIIQQETGTIPFIYRLANPLTEFRKLVVGRLPVRRLPVSNYVDNIPRVSVLD